MSSYFASYNKNILIKFCLKRLFFALFVSVNKKDKFSPFNSTLLQFHRQHNRYITRVRASVERREDRADREVMNKAVLERSTIPQNGWWQIRREDCTGA